MLMVSPIVSVIIPSFNNGHFLGRAIQSVLKQTHSEYELIVVDDGSVDDTAGVVSRYAADARVRYLHQENRGPSAARNSGIRAALGEVIAFLDADDWWLPIKLERQLEIMRRHPDIGVVYSDYRLSGASDSTHEKSHTRKPAGKQLYEELLYRNIIAGSASSVMIRTSCFRTVGYFDERMPGSEDLDMWRRLARCFRFIRLEEVHVVIERRSDSLQMDLDKMAIGKLRYLEKLHTEVLQEYRCHLPEITYRTYQSIAWQYMRNRQFIKAIPFIYRIVRANPYNIYRFCRDVAGKLVRWGFAKRSYQQHRSDRNGVKYFFVNSSDGGHIS